MTSGFWTQYQDILLIAGLGLAIRFAAVPLIHFEGYTGDEREYVYLGERLSKGSGFIDSNGNYSTRSPLYPFLLGSLFAISGLQVFLPHLIGCLIGGLCIILVYLLALRLFSDKRAALFAGGAAAVYPGLIVYSAMLQTETLFIALFLGVFLSGYALVSNPSIGRGAFLGILSGAAALTRGVFLAAVPFLLFAFWWIGRKTKVSLTAPLLAGVFAFVVVVLPWAIRNYAIHQTFVPISLFGGTSLLLGNNPYSTGTWSTKPGFEEWQDSEVRSIRGVGIQDLSESERSSANADLAIRFIASEPMWALEGAVWKAYMFWVFPISNSDSNTLLQFVAVASDFLLLLGTSLGLVFCPGRRSAALLPIAVPVVVFSIVHIVLHAEARYRLPLIPLLLVLFGIGIGVLSREGTFRSLAPAGRQRVTLALIILLVVTVYGYTGVLFLQGRV